MLREFKFNIENHPLNRITIIMLSVSTEEEIAVAEGILTKENFLLSVIMVRTKFEQKGFGLIIFKKLFYYFLNQSIIEGILGSWHMDKEFYYLEDHKSTNLRIFEMGIAKGLSCEDAALKTPTGKWSIKLGYEKVKIIKQSKEEVTILFYK